MGTAITFAQFTKDSIQEEYAPLDEILRDQVPAQEATPGPPPASGLQRDAFQVQRLNFLLVSRSLTSYEHHIALAVLPTAIRFRQATDPAFDEARHILTDRDWFSAACYHDLLLDPYLNERQVWDYVLDKNDREEVIDMSEATKERLKDVTVEQVEEHHRRFPHCPLSIICLTALLETRNAVRRS